MAITLWLKGFLQIAISLRDHSLQTAVLHLVQTLDQGLLITKKPMIKTVKEDSKKSH
jgi:hypothetical protein